MPQIPGGFELILILAVVLLLFGGKKIPQLAKGLGEGIRNFKKSVKDDFGFSIARKLHKSGPPKSPSTRTTLNPIDAKEIL